MGLRYFLTTPCHIDVYIRAASMFLSAHSIARQCLASEPYRVSCHIQVHQLSWWWKSELPRYTAAREVKCFWNALRIIPLDHRVILLLHFTSRAACQSPRASFMNAQPRYDSFSFVFTWHVGACQLVSDFFFLIRCSRSQKTMFSWPQVANCD